jgi:hypothetical protein
MPLCETCDSLDFEQDDLTDSGIRLGPFKDLLTRAENGCDACEFFCNVLQTSTRWTTRLDELAERVVFLDSSRLDARKPTKLGNCTYCADDLCLDQCVSEDSEGVQSLC